MQVSAPFEVNAAPDSYRLTMTYNGVLNGTLTNGTAMMEFNTALSDSNPPVVQEIQVLDAGNRREKVLDGHGQIAIRAEDATAGMTLQIDIDHGAGWQSLPVTYSAGFYRANVPAFATTTGSTSVSLRISAQDQVGNRLVNTIAPAFIVIRGPCVEPPSDMVAWWPMDETSGAASLHDIVGGNNTTPYPSPVGAGQAPQPVTGMVDGAIDFPKFGNGLSGARVSTLSSALHNIGADDFTIDAWVKFPPSTAADKLHYIVNRFDQNKGYSLYIINERLGFKWGDGTNVASVHTDVPFIAPNQWHYVAVTFTRDMAGELFIRLYVNGIQQGLKVVEPLGSLANFAYLEIGWQPSGLDEPISIDELEIFNRALSQQEIQDLSRRRFGGQMQGKGSDIVFAPCA